MGKFFFAIALLTTVCVSSPARANAVNELLEDCEIQKPITDLGANGRCYFYLMGVVDTLAANGYRSYDFRLCLPDYGTYQQSTTHIWKYIQDHREVWDTNAAQIGYLALYQAYPCK